MIYTTQQTNTTATPNTLGGTYIHNGGQVLTTNGTSPYWIDTTAITNANLSQNGLHVNGDAEFIGDIKLKGKSLDKTLTMIEERLAILHPNEKLEEKWEKLRDLRKQYMELESDILEKEKIMEILKR